MIYFNRENKGGKEMKNAYELQGLINKVKSKLKVEGININDYDKCIACLKKTVAPKICIQIYEEYINY